MAITKVWMVNNMQPQCCLRARSENQAQARGWISAQSLRIEVVASVMRSELPFLAPAPASPIELFHMNIDHNRPLSAGRCHFVNRMPATFWAITTDFCFKTYHFFWSCAYRRDVTCINGYFEFTRSFWLVADRFGIYRFLQWVFEWEWTVSSRK